jgi:hypothetical protein
MAIKLQELKSVKPSGFKTATRPKALELGTNDGLKEVQYRQLVSRAVTQRLHSPSLDDFTKIGVNDTLAHTLEAWEVQERCIARSKARIEAEMLGIPWGEDILFCACIAPLHIKLDTQIQGLTASSAICPRCRKRHSARPRPHANTVRSPAEKDGQKPRSE